MLILISPAKSLDFTDTGKQNIYTKPILDNKSQQLIDILKPLSTDSISQLMKISPNLSQLNVDRYNAWQLPFTIDNSKQALMAFTGEVYTGIDALSLSAKEIETAQNSLRILSGLYGILKPMDLIQAYRLEMGTKLENSEGSNLYKFWGNIISNQINDTLEKLNKKYIINLASQEYFKSVNTKILTRPIVTPIFKDLKNGEYKTISFFAKKARGMMCRYIIKNNINTIEDLMLFDAEGYTYNDRLSDGLTICFTRDKKL